MTFTTRSKNVDPPKYAQEVSTLEYVVLQAIKNAAIARADENPQTGLAAAFFQAIRDLAWQLRFVENARAIADGRDERDVVGVVIGRAP